MDKVLVIVGPTASGKSALAVSLACHYNGEIISGDSVQVYRQLNIGTAKITTAEQKGIPHHLLDIKDFTENYSVYDFQKKGREIIKQLNQNNKLPIVVGGTGLYIKALLYDYQFKEEDNDVSDYQDFDNQELYNMIQVQDPQAAAKLHKNNRKRLLRTLSLLASLPTNKSDFLAQQKKQAIYDVLIIGLTLDRRQLHQRISDRVEMMFSAGLLKEVESLVKGDLKVFDYQAFQAIGYKEFKAFFLNENSLEEIKEKIRAHTRQFAKRQYTWFNNQMPVQWVDSNKSDYLDKIHNLVNQWL